MTTPPDRTDAVPVASDAAGTGASGVFAPGRRMLTGGLVLIVTLVASEALAISTVMPLVEEDLVIPPPEAELQADDIFVDEEMDSDPISEEDILLPE